MSNTDPIRWQQRLENFKKSLARLEDACAQKAYSELERAGLIQFFELAFELSWKSLKDLLFYEGFDAKSPREVIRQAFAAGLLSEDDTETFLDALTKRNLLAHVYEEKTAEEAVLSIKIRFLPVLQRARESLEQRRNP